MKIAAIISMVFAGGMAWTAYDEVLKGKAVDFVTVGMGVGSLAAMLTPVMWLFK